MFEFGIVDMHRWHMHAKSNIGENDHARRNRHTRNSVNETFDIELYLKRKFEHLVK